VGQDKKTQKEKDGKITDAKNLMKENLVTHQTISETSRKWGQ